MSFWAWADGWMNNEEISRNGDYGMRSEVKLCSYQVGEVPWVLSGNVE